MAHRRHLYRRLRVYLRRYLHNTLGRMELHPSDPASDGAKARALPDTCLELTRSYR